MDVLFPALSVCSGIERLCWAIGGKSRVSSARHAESACGAPLPKAFSSPLTFRRFTYSRTHVVLRAKQLRVPRSGCSLPLLRYSTDAGSLPSDDRHCPYHLIRLSSPEIETSLIFWWD